MTSKTIAASVASIGLALLCMAPVGAQVPGSAAETAGDGAHGGRMHRDMQRRHEQRPFSRPTERVEARLAYAKTALKITDAQQAQWDAFANVARRQAAEREKMMQERRARMGEQRGGQRPGERERARPGAIERMELAQRMHATAIQRINQRLEVQKPLYAVLSNEQKEIADVVLAPRGGHGGMHGGGRGGRGMRHGMG